MHLSLFFKKMKRLSKKAYRTAFFKAHLDQGIAHQIRVLRQQRNMTQAQLADRMGTRQSAISRLEDPSYGNYTLNQLAELASAYDVALMVKFVSFGRLLRETEDVSPKALSVLSYDEELSELSEHHLVKATSTNLSINPTGSATQFYLISNFASKNLSPQLEYAGA